MKKVVLLGASGSIGSQTIAIINQFNDHFSLVAFSVGRNIMTIGPILAKHPNVKAICVQLLDDQVRLKKQYPHLHIYYGDQGLLQLIDHVNFDLLVNGLVGFVGLAPTLHCLNKGQDVALANKEALVVGGALIKETLKTSKAQIIPIDSEHVALDKLLKHADINEVDALILTASGGPLFHLNSNQLKEVTIKQALAHPSWKMGPKISIDSATMVNKAFEIIEAYYLFDWPLNKIEVIIHPTSNVHSAIRYKDGTYGLDFGPNDMRIPISYALFNRKKVTIDKIEQLNLDTVSPLSFIKVPEGRFKMLDLAKRVIEEGGIKPCLFNGANEGAVHYFLKGRIRFDQIELLIEKVVATIDNITIINYETLKKAHLMALDLVRKLVEERTI